MTELVPALIRLLCFTRLTSLLTPTPFETHRTKKGRAQRTNNVKRASLPSSFYCCQRKECEYSIGKKQREAIKDRSLLLQRFLPLHHKGDRKQKIRYQVRVYLTNARLRAYSIVIGLR